MQTQERVFTRAHVHTDTHTHAIHKTKSNGKTMVLSCLPPGVEFIGSFVACRSIPLVKSYCLGSSTASVFRLSAGASALPLSRYLPTIIRCVQLEAQQAGSARSRVLTLSEVICPGSLGKEWKEVRSSLRSPLFYVSMGKVSL